MPRVFPISLLSPELHAFWPCFFNLSNIVIKCVCYSHMCLTLTPHPISSTRSRTTSYLNFVSHPKPIRMLWTAGTYFGEARRGSPTAMLDLVSGWSEFKSYFWLLVTVGSPTSPLISLSLTFSTCKMKMITAPILQGLCEYQMRQHVQSPFLKSCRKVSYYHYTKCLWSWIKLSGYVQVGKNTYVPVEVLCTVVICLCVCFIWPMALSVLGSPAPFP